MLLHSQMWRSLSSVKSAIPILLTRPLFFCILIKNYIGRRERLCRTNLVLNLSPNAIQLLVRNRVIHRNNQVVDVVNLQLGHDVHDAPVHHIVRDSVDKQLK